MFKFKNLGITIGIIVLGSLMSAGVIQAAFLTTPSTSGGIGGTGSAHFVPKWTDEGNQGVSVIYQNGSNVGIGTFSPRKELDVLGSVKASEFCIGANCIEAWPSGAGEGDNLGNHSATKNIRLNSSWLSGDGGNEGIRINAVGNVGIGVSNPGSMLQIGDNAINPTIILESTSSGDNNTAQSAGIEFGESVSARGSIWYTGDGYMHIGMNDRSREYMRFIYSANRTWLYGNLYLDASGNNTYFPNNGIWNSSGSVGIGVANPTQKLDVAGVGNFSGVVYGYTPGSSQTNAFTTVAYVNTAISNIPAGSDIYWTGTATNLNAATGRTSLGLGALATKSSITASDITSGTITNTQISTSAKIAASKINFGSGSAGQVWTSNSAGVGSWQAAPTSPAGSDIYWTGTATNLNAATGRTSLGLGALATKSSITASDITSGTITNTQISTSAKIAASKINFGNGSAGQVWTSNSAGVGSWQAGGIGGSGTVNRVSKWTATGAQGNSIIFDNGTNVGIGTTAPSQKLHVAGVGNFSGVVYGYTPGSSQTNAFTTVAYVNTAISNIPAGSDIYWTGTSTNLNAATGRTSLGLGALATKDKVSSTDIEMYAIKSYHIENKAIPSNKINFGSGSAGQVWTSNSAGVGSWQAAPTSPAGSDIYWTGTATNLNAATGRTSLGLGALATKSSITASDITSGTITNTQISTSAKIAASKINFGNGSAGQVWTSNSAGVGSWQAAPTSPAGSDIYWTGTATNLNAATGRTSLGLGALATKSSITASDITSGTITNTQISTSAKIAASKINFGNGSAGQVWTSNSAGVGSWQAGGIGGSGTVNRVSKWTATGAQGNSIIFDNGTNVGIGNTSPGFKLEVSGDAYATSWQSGSDSRFKKNVSEMDNILPSVMKLRPVSFDWDQENFPERNFSDKTEYGFIAQEVEKEFPYLVRTDSDGYKSLMYDRFSTILLQAIKEQQNEIVNLNERVDRLEAALVK